MFWHKSKNNSIMPRLQMSYLLLALLSFADLNSLAQNLELCKYNLNKKSMNINSFIALNLHQIEKE
jgi:hypothetical protein